MDEQIINKTTYTEWDWSEGNYKKSAPPKFTAKWPLDTYFKPVNGKLDFDVDVTGCNSSPTIGIYQYNPSNGSTTFKDSRIIPATDASKLNYQLMDSFSVSNNNYYTFILLSTSNWTTATLKISK